MSRTFRLSGLSPGAKLQLVRLSRSPSVVSVALQLPESEAIETPNNRLTGKFPSNTTLWLILRKFESGVAGDLGLTRNFTARGIPRGGEEASGSGRLYHESPVIQVMGRELVSFTDLQKTLGQLGFNNGTALLRLSFRVSETPLEEAMEQIEQYFSSIDEKDKDIEIKTNSNVDPSSPQSSTSEPPIPEGGVTIEPDTQRVPPGTPPVEQLVISENTPPTLVPAAVTIAPGPDQRQVTVFAPPSSSVPYAARQTFNEEDYEPTLDHARLHQARLTQSSRNQRLPTNAEIAAQQEVQRQKTANVKEVEIKIRFPDQTQIVSKFSDTDTGSSLYSFVKSLLDKETEPFLLKFSAARGPKTVPNDPDIKLIGGLAMTGRVLVNFIWDEGASVEARGSTALLKDQLQSQAQEIPIPEIRELAPLPNGYESPGSRAGLEALAQANGEAKGKGKVPRWLKLPGKK